MTTVMPKRIRHWDGEYITLEELNIKIQIQSNTPDRERLELEALVRDGVDVETMVEEYLRAQLPPDSETGLYLRCKQSAIVRVP